MPVSMQLNVHMSNERAVIAGKFRRARYVISIKARTHNYTVRGGSPCRNTVVNIFQFCAQLEGKKKSRERRKNETKTENQKKRESESASVFIEFAKNIFVFRVLPRTPSAFPFYRPLPPLSFSLFFSFRLSILSSGSDVLFAAPQAEKERKREEATQ